MNYLPFLILHSTYSLPPLGRLSVPFPTFLGSYQLRWMDPGGDFSSSAPYHPPALFLFRDTSHKDFLRQEIQSLLALGAIKLVSPDFITERVLFLVLPRPEEKRGMEIHPGPQDFKYLCPLPMVQNGDSNNSNSLSGSRRLVCFPQPLGCLFSCHHSSLAQTTPTFYGRQGPLPVLHPTLQPLCHPKGIYQSSVSSSSLSSLERHHSLSLSGRLAPKVSLISQSTDSNQQGPVSVSLSGSQLQLGEV